VQPSSFGEWTVLVGFFTCCHTGRRGHCCDVEVTAGCRFVYDYCTLHQRLLGDQIKEDQMGGACSADGTDDKGTPSFRQKTLTIDSTWKT
jgi:hypothetical protein